MNDSVGCPKNSENYFCARGARPNFRIFFSFVIFKVKIRKVSRHSVKAKMSGFFKIFKNDQRQISKWPDFRIYPEDWKH